MYMKKLSVTLVAFAMIAFFCIGCQPGEPLNKECDILDITLEESDWLSGISIGENEATIFVKEGADITKLTPIITVTEGAKIDPASGVTRDFKYGVKYVVTSEDGEWSKPYIIWASFLADVKNLTFDFNDWKLVTNKKGGDYWNPVKDWASGNPGVATLRAFTPDPSKKPDYPTLWVDDVIDGAVEGKAALMLNQIGYGAPAGYVVPGSLFLGTFNANQALQDPLSCPQFGMPVYCTKNHLPTMFSFDYKYKPGAVFIDQYGEILPNEVDKCNMYAVLFSGKGALTPREMTDKGFDNPRIIAHAQLPDRGNSFGWRHMDIEFQYRNEPIWDSGDIIQIAIVLTASLEGDLFRGAVGSELIVDNVTVR